MSDEWKEGHLYVNRAGGLCPVLCTDGGWVMLRDTSCGLSEVWSPHKDMNPSDWEDMGNISKHLYAKLGDYFI